jgi:choline kinase
LINQNPSCISTFAEVSNKPLGDVAKYYVQSCTNLKWEKSDKSDLKWADCDNDDDNKKCNTYKEPTWD